jgi:fluoroacetyl-CoA thioesterase
MKDIPLGGENRIEIMPEERHLASMAGNAGVDVVSTPSLIGFLEMASHGLVLPYCDADEISVGTRVEVDHLAAAHLGRPIIAQSRIVAVEKRRITFEVEARQDDRIIMKGRHGRAIARHDKLLGQKS